MIGPFLESWPLFREAYLAGWLAGVILSLAGVLVLARDRVFAAAASSQASTLGVALGILLAAGESGAAPVACAASVVAMLLTWGRPGASSHGEGIWTAWIFLAGGSLSVLLLSRNPHGLEAVHRLASSSVIGADDADVAALSILALLFAALLAWGHERLLLTALDPEMAAASGLRVRLWHWGTAAAVGLAIGISLPCLGVLSVFGNLVLPAFASRFLCREARWMFVVAPFLSIAASTAGFVLSHAWDLPPGQVIVTVLCAGVLAARGLKAL